ncbi:MAG TPA: hypothetical protein VNG33_21945 [Polyangiaceae bacterium]|nr:hypothetical protein [Polyangiaceae bacterium]
MATSSARPALAEELHATDHELLRAFAEEGLALNPTLREMLNEHYSHRTERRGAGFTQATRHLAAFVNGQRPSDEPAALGLFLERAPGARALANLRSLPARLEREESRILAEIIVDLVFPAVDFAAGSELRAWPDELKIGTCPLAEKYFLELAEAFVRRKGVANILVSPSGEPLLVEKLNLGDNHSCISVAPLRLNGVSLPPGSLLGARYEPGIALRKNRSLPGEVIPIARCSGFRFLRLSTLAVSPQHRERAFTSHFQAQLAAGLFAPGEATIGQLLRLAREQL